MKIVFATNNPHKLAEAREILGPGFELATPAACGITEEIPETEPTLEGNARLKARYIYERTGLDCFADDTGLEVAALGGAPGVYSARYAGGPGHDSAANMACLLRNMEDIADRRARFRTAVCLIEAGREHLFEGTVEGEITREPAGCDGFGYDPVFRPEGRQCTFAEMSHEEKNAISHRGRAMQRLAAYLHAAKEK